MPARKATAHFVANAICSAPRNCPDSPEWLTELKLDGYRALAIKSGAAVQLRSCNDNDFSLRYPGIVRTLAYTIIYKYYS